MITEEEQVTTDTIPQAEEYAPGEIVPALVTKSRVWKPDELRDEGILGCIESLLKSCFQTDEAPRRWQVVETWEARMLDRGYQHLEATREGGWSVAGAGGGDKNGIAEQNDAGLFATNILGAQGDIAVGALNRGAVKVNFSPRRSKRPEDVAAAAAANEYKWLWAKYNDRLQSDITTTGWTDSRAVLWTRTVADQRFGLDDEGNPRQIEITTAHGVLESRLPMMADHLRDCGNASVFEELDYGIARATYPWVGKKLKPSFGTFGEAEFERIARINTRVGVMGRYVTGISGIRTVSMGYHWLRPGTFWSDEITDEQRDTLLSQFPKGLFVVTGGPEICAAWEESVDEHVEMGMFARGFGQNRRALGTSDLPIQKRINLWADLIDSYFRAAIPMTLLDDQAFNTEAISELEATPRRFLPVAMNEGQTMQGIVGQTPVPTPTPGLMEMFQYYLGPLIQSIDGATPALFGGGEGQDNTVGATMIRLNQALERYGSPWQMVNTIMARAAWQAVKCCAANSETPIEESVEGHGDVAINPEIMGRGEVTCTPETLGSIPESGSQREAKILQILDMAAANAQVASIVATPSNAREIVRALHIDDVITVDEADSEDKQLEEIELLLEQQPLLNPDWQKATEQLEALTQQIEAAATAVASGMPPDPQVVEQGQEMEKQAASLEQQIQQTPQYLPSVPVADDESEDHATEAATCFSWMQTPDGREIRRKAGREQPGDQKTSPSWAKWTNVHLHWQGHTQMAAKFTKSSAPPPKVNLTGKLDPSQQAQLLGQAGVQTDPAAAQQPNEVEQEQRLYGPQGEAVIKTKRRL